MLQASETVPPAGFSPRPKASETIFSLRDGRRAVLLVSLILLFATAILCAIITALIMKPSNKTKASMSAAGECFRHLCKGVLSTAKKKGGGGCAWFELAWFGLEEALGTVRGAPQNGDGQICMRQAEPQEILWYARQVSDLESLFVFLTLFRARGGHIVPPQVNFLKYLKNALSYRVETF